MRARFAVLRLLIPAVGLIVASATSLLAQNPFAPATPAPAAGAAPATPAAPPSTANPFGSGAMPAQTTPTAPATTEANPFGTPSTPATPGISIPAQPGAATPSALPPGLPTVAVPPAKGNYRVLAPGVMRTIPSPIGIDDLQSTHDLVEVVAELPNYGERETAPNRKPGRGIRFAHDVWGLEFSFKPVRFIRLKNADGTDRLVWYLVYNVRNGPVKRLVYDDTQPNKVREEPVTQPFLFVPRFELESYDVGKTYEEKVIPEAVAAIQAREDKNRKLYNTAEMTGEIPPSTKEVDNTIWGVATWEGVDPRTDRFSITVQGLTNAYRWADAEAGYKAGDPIGTGRSYQYQVLKLNFWRPSDPYFQHEDEIRFGMPGEVDYSWSYR